MPNNEHNFRQRIKVTENSSQHVFELLRDAFIYTQDTLDSVKKEVKHSILTGSSKWSAKIDIEVINKVIFFIHEQAELPLFLLDADKITPSIRWLRPRV